MTINPGPMDVGKPHDLGVFTYVYEVTNPKVAISMVRRTKSPSGADDERVGCLGLIKMLLLFNTTNLRIAITSEMVDVTMENICIGEALN